MMYDDIFWSSLATLRPVAHCQVAAHTCISKAKKSKRTAPADPLTYSHLPLKERCFVKQRSARATLDKCPVLAPELSPEQPAVHPQFTSTRFYPTG